MFMPEYMAGVASEMTLKSASIRRDFAQNRLSAGENREDLVQQFLSAHLPKRFGVDSGFVLSTDGRFSNQADLLIVDQENNAPFYPDYRNKLWPVEAAYGLVEVKTNLTPVTLHDAISKGRRFKTLPREFCSVGYPQPIKDSLFVIWSFQSPSPKIVKANLVKLLSGVPSDQQPDLVIVLDRLVAHMGQYWEMVTLGEPGSRHRKELELKHQGNLSHLTNEPLTVYDLGENSLLAWYVWIDSWLRRAGSRFCDPIRYLPPHHQFGTKI